MTTVEPPAGLDLRAIRERAEDIEGVPHGPAALWAISRSADDVPVLVAEVEALRLQVRRLRQELDEVRAERDRLREHILDIDAHATPYGDIPDEPGWVGTYLLTAGALHRALGKIGHSAPNCQAEEDLNLTRQAFEEYRECWHRAEAALLAALERRRPVVEAAEVWASMVKAWGGPLRKVPGSIAGAEELLAAVDAYRSSTPDAEPAPGGEQ